jgi:hypothetical protein
MCNFSSIVCRKNGISNKVSTVFVLWAHMIRTLITQSCLVAHRKRNKQHELLTSAFLKLRNGNIWCEGEIGYLDRWGDTNKSGYTRGPAPAAQLETEQNWEAKSWEVSSFISKLKKILWIRELIVGPVRLSMNFLQSKRQLYWIWRSL